MINPQMMKPGSGKVPSIPPVIGNKNAARTRRPPHRLKNRRGSRGGSRLGGSSR